jgi:CheY-like chemotaxis protein
MTTKHILFVEDEVTQLDMFESAVGDWNGKNEGVGKAFTFDVARTVEEAYSALTRLRCDAALFDLRVTSEADGGKSEPRGNELARQALKERGIPVAIISANTGELDDDVRTAGAVAVFDKNDPHGDEGNYYDRALAWLGSQWDMMDVLGQARRAMDASAADIFLLRLWPRWKMFAELETADREELVSIVTRQYVSHMADMLGLDDPANVSWHPFENYVSPALMSARAHTGDIFEFEGTLWVVLTPQCDMATQKVDNAILAKCVPGITDWPEMVDVYKAQASAKSIERSTKFFMRLVNQNVEPSRHFLPALPGKVEPILVHFSSVMTMPLGDLNGALEHRVASIASPFLSNIVQRFGAYVSRTGQPNIDIARF